MPTDYEANQFADSYVRFRGLSEVFVETWASRLVNHIPADEVTVVLDVGAGVGRFWPVLQAAWSPATVVAVDRSLAMLTRVDMAANVHRVVGDLDALPVSRRGGFDAVFCSMALHYSRDPRACVEALAASIRPGGWLCVRTGTHDTLASYDFLRFFPTALTAERRAMPELSALLQWLAVPLVGDLNVEEFPAGTPETRWRALWMVLGRGFPSLQLVPSAEWAWGSVRYALHLAFTWAARTARPQERSVLVTARRSL